MSTNDENIPAPSSTAVVLTVHTPRRRIISMSTSGSRARCSLRTHSAASTAAAAISPSTRAEPQPQAGPSLMAKSSATSQLDSSAAPPQLTRPGVLIGDSGTKKCVATSVTTTAISGNQNSQW